MNRRRTISEPAGVQGFSPRLWIIAAATAVLIHVVGVAFAIASRSTDDADDESGAPGLVIGLELAAPRSEPTDLPPGPDTDASTASPSVVEQKQMLKQSDLPKDTPTETDDPDRVVSANSSKNPQDDPNTPAVQATPSTEAVAAEATAVPSSEIAAPSDQSVTLAQGSGEAKRRVRTTWEKEMVAFVDRHKRYPADRSLKTARMTVGFQLDRTGHILSTSIIESSGDPSFDEAAIAMLKRSDPVPAPPPLIADETLSFTLPVVFRVKGRS